MVDATIFIPFIIIAITQVIKMFAPAVHGGVTILVALLVGVVLAIIDTHIGVTDISIAQGLLLAGSAVGITVAAAKAGGGAKGDDNVTARER